MKIGPSNTEGGRVDGRPVGAERAAPVRPGAGSEPVSASVPVEKVSVSTDRAALLGPSGGVPFDDAKVEEIRRAIAEGRFPVDARRVAERLFDQARDLLGLEPAAR